MNYNDIVKERRSIRSFLDKDVSTELIYKLLDYGHAAPSAGNIQPWEFIIIRNEENKRAVVGTTFIGRDEKNGKPQEWMMTAPVFIVVCGNQEKVRQRYGDTSLDSILYLDTSACIENILLGAVYLGLGSCYVSGFRKDELVKVLRLPEDYQPIAILPIGYSNEVPYKRPKINVKKIIHFEIFGEQRS